MQTYSKSHERDENRKINQGFWNSVFALLFCWLPGIGLLLAIMGFFREIVRLTQQHRVKRVFCTIFSSIVLIVCVFALVGEAYLYINNPNILHETAVKGWTALTGEDTLPWEAGEYYDYADDTGDIPDPALDDTDLYEDEYYADDTGEYDYDADFDDSELAGFDEEAPDGSIEEGDAVDGALPDSDAPPVDMSLLDDMLQNRRSGLSGL